MDYFQYTHDRQSMYAAQMATEKATIATTA